MLDRKKQIEELMSNFQAMKRKMIAFNRHFPALGRITVSQWQIVSIVEEHEPISIKKIAKELGISSSAVTQHVHDLEKNGYLVRKEDSADRRAIEVCFSPKTRNFIRAKKKKWLEHSSSIFSVLSDREFNIYIQLQKKILRETFKKKITEL